MTVGHSNLYKRLKTKEKVVIADDLCLMVAGVGFIRLRSPFGPPKGVAYAIASAEPVVQTYPT